MKSALLAFALIAPASAASAAPPVTLTAGGKPVLEYRTADTLFKPYVAQLYTPAGVAVLRDAPADHLHHHGLMFALGIEGVSFWEERPASGRQVSRSFTCGQQSISQSLEWTMPDGRIALREERNITVHDPAGRSATWLTWRSRLQAPPDREGVKLTGSHYYGLGARFVAAMDTAGVFINSAGAAGDVVRGTERLSTAAWCAYTATADGKPVTFAIFDHPANLHHPPRLFTMTAPFAYLATTLNLWKEPYRLEATRPIDLRYGVAVWDGKSDHAAIDALYRRWVKLAE